MKHIAWIELEDGRQYNVYHENDVFTVDKNVKGKRHARKDFAKAEFLEFINQLPIELEEISDKIQELIK